MKPLLRFAAITVLLSLTACGFQLRGSGGNAFSVERIHVTAADPNGDMARTLKDALKQAGATLVDEAGAQYSVNLLGERRTRRAAATSADVRVSEYELQIEVQFELSSGGKTVIPSTSVSAQRIYRFDSSSLVGSNEEEKLLNDEMRRDIAGQIIRRIDATARSAKGT